MSTKALDKLRTDLQGRLEGLQNDYDEQENALADAANKWMNADRCLEQSEQVTRLQPYLALGLGLGFGPCPCPCPRPRPRPRLCATALLTSTLTHHQIAEKINRHAATILKEGLKMGMLFSPVRDAVENFKVRYYR